MTQALPLDQTTRYLADKAANNYAAHSDQIDKIVHRITENRNGMRSLTDITDDKTRLFRRAAREGGQFEQALERINGIPNFQDMAIVRKIVQASTSVCRIILQGRSGISGYGTGFLIAPNVLITNNHVFPDADTASRAIAQFNYELGDHGQTLAPVSFRLRPDLFFLTSPYTERADTPFSGRDFTLVAVEPANPDGATLSQFGYIRLDASLGKIIEGENCVVIQHPKGDYKKVVLKDIRLITLTENFLIYEADTQPGSSGSLVLGLGTADAVGLHHSAVPRKDANGNWLRKDGKIRQPGDADDDIDWIGNEGVRVSCIVEAFNNLPIPDFMQPIKTQILDAQTPVVNIAGPVPTPVKSPSPAIVKPVRTEAAPLPAPVSPLPGSSAKAAGLLSFEVLLTDQTSLQTDWDRRSNELVPGLVEQTPLLPTSVDPFVRRMRYLTVRSPDNPWTVAASIEGLPQVESCRPDLETLTDVGRSGTETAAPVHDTENFLFNDGSGEPNEGKFLDKWGKSIQVKAALKNGKNQQRWWNRYAVNWPDMSQNPPVLSQSERDRLAQMRLVQLDTGYSAHSKVAGGYNTDLDFDFIDVDFDARDEEAMFGFKFPFHGTRTASLVVGGPLADPATQLDGNAGLLVTEGTRLTRLIPYRVAESVILLQRTKQVVDGVNYAIRSGADVLFMCMGSYPRPMLDAIARDVYEKGVIWACAAGNEVGLVVAPALYPGTIAVAATNPDDLPWSGSSHGPAVDISAPGEDVYVPFLDKQRREIMAYGSGTSYATPQVAAAALLWKARHYDALGQYLPWQVVEAFRTALKESARKGQWTTSGYGAGILDIANLLAQPLPASDTLIHVYRNRPETRPHSVGIAEAAHVTWNAAPASLAVSSESTLAPAPITQYGQQALNAFAVSPPASDRESSSTVTDADALLRYYFNQ